MAQLIVLYKAREAATHELTGNVVTLGQHQDNMIVLDDERISRYHAKIVFRGGKYFVRDLDSTNGTKVNGQSIKEQQLHASDVITFSELECIFKYTRTTTETLSPRSGDKNTSQHHKALSFVLICLIAAGLAATGYVIYQKHKHDHSTASHQSNSDMSQGMSSGHFGKFTYADKGAFIAITGYPRDDVGPADIPTTITGKPVTCIEERAFLGCDSLKDVRIPNGVTWIRGEAFKDCSKLTSLTLPASLTAIDEDAFKNCISLTRLTVPGSVITIGRGAFYYCWGLTNVTIEPGVKVIGDSAFGKCSKLTSITIPASVRVIGDGGFRDCKEIATVTIPAGVKKILYDAFRDCVKLTSAEFLGDAPEMYRNVFSGVGSGFAVIYNRGATGFTSPMWEGYPATRRDLQSQDSTVSKMRTEKALGTGKQIPLSASEITQIIELAEAGNVKAQSSLGFAYCTGEGVRKDPVQGVKWALKAAEQGDLVAQGLLARAYRIGEGVAKDPVQAYMWTRKAAQQGLASCQGTLGAMYLAGFGVEKDTVEGVRWLRKAANQGDADAINVMKTYGIPRE